MCKDLFFIFLPFLWCMSPNVIFYFQKRDMVTSRLLILRSFLKKHAFGLSDCLVVFTWLLRESRESQVLGWSGDSETMWEAQKLPLDNVNKNSLYGSLIFAADKTVYKVNSPSGLR